MSSCLRKMGIVKTHILRCSVLFLMTAGTTLLEINSVAASPTETRYLLVNGVQFEIEVPVAPDTPNSIAAILVLPYGIDVSWSQSYGADEYILEWRAPGDVTWGTLYEGSESHYELASPNPLGRYLFRVSACANDLCSDPSINRSITINEQPDSDNDGVLDFEDQCMNTPEYEQVDENGCSDTQIDSDGDGVFDAFDLCQNTAPGVTVNIYGCEENADDIDGDGIPNADDPYPFQNATQCTG